MTGTTTQSQPWLALSVSSHKVKERLVELGRVLPDTRVTTLGGGPLRTGDRFVNAAGQGYRDEDVLFAGEDERRHGDLAEFETAMRYLDQPVHAYLAQLAVIQQRDTTSRLGEVAVPSLVLAGEQDILIPVSLSRRIHEAIPGSEWATTRGGHACVWEHPAEFNQTFLDFVRRHGKG